MSDHLTSKAVLPPLPKNDHAFCDPEGEQPDILVWRDYSMRAYAATAVADHQAEIDRLTAELAESERALGAARGLQEGTAKLLAEAHARIRSFEEWEISINEWMNERCRKEQQP